MTNARAIINQAARKIHVLGRGQTMDANEYQDALEILNTMLGSLSTNVGLIFNNTRETFQLTGQASYPIGVGQVFDTVAPIFIQDAYITIGEVDYTLRQMNAEEYSNVAFKNLSGIPDSFYYEKNTPVARIFIYPLCTAYTLTLYSLKPFTAFANLTTNYDLPPGADDMLVYNLAVRLASEYEKEAAPTVKAIAEKTLRNVEAYNKRNNYPKSMIDIAGDSSALGNILSGWYIR